MKYSEKEYFKDCWERIEWKFDIADNQKINFGLFNIFYLGYKNKYIRFTKIMSTRLKGQSVVLNIIFELSTKSVLIRMFFFFYKTVYERNFTLHVLVMSIFFYHFFKFLKNVFKMVAVGVLPSLHRKKRQEFGYFLLIISLFMPFSHYNIK